MFPAFDGKISALLKNVKLFFSRSMAGYQAEGPENGQIRFLRFYDFTIPNSGI